MNTAEQQRDWLLAKLNNLMLNGIFPAARTAAHSILEEYAAANEQEKKDEHDDHQ